MTIGCKNCENDRASNQDEETNKRRIEIAQANDKNLKKIRAIESSSINTTKDLVSSKGKTVNSDALNYLVLTEPNSQHITENEPIQLKEEIYDIQINHDWNDNSYENNNNEDDDDDGDVVLNNGKDKAINSNNLTNLLTPKSRGKGINSFQKAELKNIFSDKKYISCEERIELSKRLDLTQVQIKDWFKNHRKILRRTLEKQKWSNNNNLTNS